MEQTNRRFFSDTFGAEPEVMARAPGRIEFIGNHTDYNDGRVMGAAIDRYILVSARIIAAPVYRFITDEGKRLVAVEVGRAQPLTAPEDQWVNYPLGVIHFLREAGFALPAGGAEFAFTSNLPSGAGLSSSAALMVATGTALGGLIGTAPERTALARICQQAENVFVGMPCGILDPAISLYGAKDHLVHIDCAALKFRNVRVPSGLRLWVFDSGTKHRLVDSAYAARRKECEEAFRGLSEHFPEARSLSDISSSQLESAREWLDPLLHRRASHIVMENFRVNAVECALATGDLPAVGRALLESHASSRDSFENSTPELDALVEILARCEGIYGARLTGGGFGGAVLAIAGERFGFDEASAAAEAFARKCGTDAAFHAFQIGEGAERLAIAITSRAPL